MCSVIKWCRNNWLSSWIVSQQSIFFYSEPLSAAASIMIINNVSNVNVSSGCG